MLASLKNMHDEAVSIIHFIRSLLGGHSFLIFCVIKQEVCIKHFCISKYKSCPQQERKCVIIQVASEQVTFSWDNIVS